LRDNKAAIEAAEMLWISKEDPERRVFCMDCFYEVEQGGLVGPRAFGRVLRLSWIRGKTGSLLTNPYWQKLSHAEIEEMFDATTPQYLMTPHERSFLRKLPDEITAFRGCKNCTLTEAQLGISWTLDKACAAWFATRFGLSGESMCIEATIPKKYVLAYFAGSEREIVVRSGHANQVRQIQMKSTEGVSWKDRKQLV
jgi:hypothetical protein